MKHSDTSIRDAGFTLLETMVALLIFSVILIWLGAGIAGGWRSVAAAEADKRALTVARALIEEAGTVWPITTGTREGIVDGGLAYRVVVTPYQASDTDAPATPSASWVTVTVAPRTPTGGARRPIILQTLKLSAAP